MANSRRRRYARNSITSDTRNATPVALTDRLWQLASMLKAAIAVITLSGSLVLAIQHILSILGNL